MDYKPWQYAQRAEAERQELEAKARERLVGKIASGATASLVCGIIGLFVLGFILGAIAIGLSRGAKSRIRENPELRGNGRATAGFVLGIVDIVGWVLGLLVMLT